jgi:type VI secretion system protein ImpL
MQEQLQQQAQQQIAKQWQQQIVPFYRHYLQGRYPIAAKAQESVSLDHFKQFFGPQGKLDRFFQNNMQPFIKREQNHWQWRPLGKKHFAFADDLLELFQRAQVIRTMFFPNNESQLNIHFSLKPKAMMPIVKAVTINLNGQSLHDKRGSRNLSTFEWPGNSNDPKAQISLHMVNGQDAQISLQGPWAWFRLLDRAKVKSLKNPKKYLLAFNIDGNAARYQLTAAHIINPFISGIVDQFHLPDDFLS